MTIKKRFTIYVLGLIWIAFCTTLINILGDQNIVSFETGKILLIYQFLPVHIIYAFYCVHRNKWLNFFLGFSIWIILNQVIPLIKTPTLTNTGDTISGVTFMVVIYWVIVSFIYECIYLINRYLNNR